MNGPACEFMPRAAPGSQLQLLPTAAHSRFCRARSGRPLSYTLDERRAAYVRCAEGEKRPR